MPSPPPPYSPPPSQDMATALRSSPALTGTPFASTQITSSSAHSPGNDHHNGADVHGAPGTSSGFRHIQASTNQGVPNSPIPGVAMSFPPPPPRAQRDRSSSRPKPDRQHSLFSLSALTSRNRQPEQVALLNAPAMSRQHSTDVTSRAPVSINDTSMPTCAFDPALQPPNARRAASTGGIGVISAPTRDRAPNTSSTPWEPGMPLPPPPPGPPPSNSRSQSMNRASERSYSSSPTPLAAPAARRPPARHGSSLGPVPPTPADWVEEHPPLQPQPDGQDRMEHPPESTSMPTASNDNNGLRSHNSGDPQASQNLENRDISLINSTSHQAQQSSSASNVGLSRTPARRDPSARGIRERRSESRAARERVEESPTVAGPSNNPWAQDMDASLVSGSERCVSLICFHMFF